MDIDEKIDFLLSDSQKAWLTTRGGRTSRDVFVKNGIPVIYMFDGYEREYKSVKVPKNFRYDIVQYHIRPL